jgi:hypothetical protein
VKDNRSWFALIRCCATPALGVALGSAILFTGVAVAVAGGGERANASAQEGDNPKETVYAGLITDDHCGARHDMDSGKNPANCTKMCIRNGSKYILVVGDKRYALAGNASTLDGLAGQRANVAGTLEGNTIKLGSTSSTSSGQ